MKFNELNVTGTYHWIITDEGKEETTTSGTVVSTKQTVGENKTNLSFRSNDLTSNSGIGSTNSILVSTNEEISSTPPLQRRLAKSFSVAPSNTQAKGFYHILVFTYFLFFLFFKL